MSLSDCVKSNPNFVKSDLKSMHDSVKKDMAAGMPRKEAEIKAAEAMLSRYEKDKADIERQVLQRYAEDNPAPAKPEPVRQAEPEPTPPKGEPVASKPEQVAPKESQAQGKEDAAGVAPEKAAEPASEAKPATPTRPGAGTINVDGVSRPTTNSSGKPIAQSDEALRNFWKWFGDSKVVDGQGRPMVVYHGTPTGGFTVFDTAKQGSKGGRARGGFSFTSDIDAAKGYAEGFSKETNTIDAMIESVNVALKKAKPTADMLDDGRADEDGIYEFDWQAFDSKMDAIEAIRYFAKELDADGQKSVAKELLAAMKAKPVGSSMVYEAYLNVPKDAPEFNATPETLGMEVAGLDVRDVPGRAAIVRMSDGSVVAYVADPTQIKSATGNNGNYSKTNPNILSANPFFDPAVWAQAAKDAGHALKALNKAMSDGLGWTLDQAGGFGKYMRDIGAEFKELTAGDPGKSKALGTPVWRMARAFWDQAGGDMLSVAKRSKSKTMIDLVKKFHYMAYDTSGEANVAYAHKTEYEHNKLFSPVATALNNVEELAKTAGRDVNKVMEQVTNLVMNPRSIRPGNPIHDAAKVIRQQLDATRKYMVEAGVEVGDAGPGYFPRQTNSIAARDNPVAYKKALIQAFQEPRQDGKPPLTLEQAKVAADDLYRTIIYGENSLFTPAGSKPQANFLQGRVFGKQVENPNHPLYPFIMHDPREVLPAYFQSSAKRAEFTRIMGNTPEKWEAMRTEMIDKDGVHPAAIEKLESFINGVAGLRNGKEGNNTAIAWLRTAGYLMFLEKQTLTSIPEFLMPAIRTGNILNVHRSLVNTIKALTSKKSPDIREMTDLMDMFGILSAHFGDIVTQNRWGGGDLESTKMTKLMQRHSRLTFITQFTEATRYGAFAVNRVFVRQLARGVKNKAGKLNTDLLAEVGVPKDKIKPFSTWLLSANNGMPTRADIEAAPKEMAALYEKAMQMLDKSEVLRPNAATRPGWTNQHPFLGLLIQLQSYSYAFFGEVWKRNVASSYRGIKDQGKAIGKAMGYDMQAEYTAAERAQMASSLIMMPLLVATHYLVGELRDKLDPKLKDLTEEEKAFRAISRGIPFAPVDPMLNVVTGAKFQRSATETIAGPTLGIAGRAIDASVEYFAKNSETSNASERAVARNVYDTVIEPGLAVALAIGYGVAPDAATRGLMMALRQTVGAGETKEQVFVQPVTPLLQELSGDTNIDPSGEQKKRSSSGGDSLAVGGF